MSRRSPHPTPQQAALLRELVRSQRFTVMGRRSRLPKEVTQAAVAERRYGAFTDLPRTNSAARSCLERMAKRGWVRVEISSGPTAYGVDPKIAESVLIAAGAATR